MDHSPYDEISLEISSLRQAQELQAQTLGVRAALQEREQLAAELHDRLSQSLAYLNVQAQTAQLYLQDGMNAAAQDCLSRLILEIGEVQEDTRALIGNLLSVSSSTENFADAMHRLLQDFQQQTGLTVHLEVGKEDVSSAGQFAFDLSQVPAPTAMQLLRITQEALSNAQRHARGISQVHLRFFRRHGQLILVIEDDGEGFDPSIFTNHGKHFGLQIMRQRAEWVGGQMFMTSTPEKGTRIEVCLPLAGD